MGDLLSAPLTTLRAPVGGAALFGVIGPAIKRGGLLLAIGAF